LTSQITYTTNKGKENASKKRGGGSGGGSKSQRKENGEKAGGVWGEIRVYAKGKLLGEAK